MMEADRRTANTVDEIVFHGKTRRPLVHEYSIGLRSPLIPWHVVDVIPAEKTTGLVAQRVDSAAVG